MSVRNYLSSAREERTKGTFGRELRDCDVLHTRRHSTFEKYTRRIGILGKGCKKGIDVMIQIILREEKVLCTDACFCSMLIYLKGDDNPRYRPMLSFYVDLPGMR
jgi:hypothetical protein